MDNKQKFGVVFGCMFTTFLYVFYKNLKSNNEKEDI